MYISRIITLALTLSIMASCDSSEKDYLVVIKTPYGDMKAILYEETPKHKENFIKLVQEGFYDSLLFHRVIQQFMIQGGDPNSKGAEPGTKLGTGGPGYTVPAEFNGEFIHKKGALSAARQPDQINPEKASSGSQFYVVQGSTFTAENLESIAKENDYRALQPLLWPMLNREDLTEVRNQLIEFQNNRDMQGIIEVVLNARPIVEAEHGPVARTSFSDNQKETYNTLGGAPHLDGGYTVFGEVVEGLEVIDKIAEQPTDQFDRPVDNVTMVVELEEVPQETITSKYGYQYPTAKQ